jgi:hypothetical protein
MPRVENDNLLREYLLGLLSEADASRIEEEYFKTEDAFERLCIAEDDLIDAYTLGELSESECSSFEQRFLVSERQQNRARFARIMLRGTPMERETVAKTAMDAAVAPWLARQLAFLRKLNPLVTASAAAAIILFLLGGWWLISSRRNAVTHQQASDAATQPQQRVTQSPAAGPDDVRQPDTRPLPGAPRVVTFALVEGTLRDPGESNRLLIPSDASTIRLRVTTDADDSEAYRETLRSVEGHLAVRPSVIGQERPASGRVIVISEVKSNLLKNGDYVLTLSAVRKSGPPEVVAEYSFNVVRR